MKELEEKLKELKMENICIADLEILNEINYQSEYEFERELTNEEKEKVFEEIHRAWLKSEGLQIYQITSVVLENFDDLDNLTTRDIVDKTCWRFA